MDASNCIARAMEEQRLYEENRSAEAAKARGSPSRVTPDYGRGPAEAEVSSRSFPLLDDLEDHVHEEAGDAESRPSDGR